MLFNRHVHIHIDDDLTVMVKILIQAALGKINHKLDNIEMKLSEIKTAVAAAAKQSTEAFAELGTRIGELQKQIDELVLDATDPDVTDETFLADLKTVQDNAKQLADIVPNPA